MIYYDLSDVTMQKMKIFFAAAKSDSLSNAAKEMGISQPLISRTISQLEESVGLELFIRNNRKLILSHQGRILLNEWRYAVEIMSKGVEKAHQLKNTDNKYFTIADDNILDKDKYLNPIITLFNNQGFKPIIDVTIGTPEYMKIGLDKRVIDIAFALKSEVPRISGPDMLSETLCKFNYCVFVSDNFPLINREWLTIDEIAKFGIVLVEPTHPSFYTEDIMNLFRNKGIEPKIDSFVHNIQSLLYKRGRTDCMIILPEFAVPTNVGKCIKIAETETSLHLIWNSKSDNPFLYPFINSCRKYFNNSSEIMR